jgi:glyoxylase-like metal-dependent hydrolase (beta-lactamase superfamily II)
VAVGCVGTATESVNISASSERIGVVSSTGRWGSLTPHVSRYSDAVTTGVVTDGDDALLVDPDGPAVAERVRERGLTPRRALYTHYHRDVTGGARALAADGISIVVPEAEREYVEDPESYWRDPEHRWHRYDFQPDFRLPARSIPVDSTVEPGERITWGDAEINVVSTPGHTDDGVSYRVSVDDRTIAFTGDLICGDGALRDAFSLQRSRGTFREYHQDYHAYLGDRDRLLEGLARLDDADTFVPLRGDPITDPVATVATLDRRLAAAHRNYARTAALRHYSPGLFETTPSTFPAGQMREVPEWTRTVDTTWVLHSDSGEALVMDCGSAEARSQLSTWIESGDFGRMDRLWITHYHDDHVDALPDLLAEYDVPVLATERVADVVESPERYRLPCGSPHAIDVDRRFEDRESWRWNEWDLTAFWFPGQTYYHSALLAEGHGLRLLFAGDSFTETGIDDYCTYNRNLLGVNEGYDRCLALIEELDPTHVFNPHLDRPFEFTADHLAFLQASLEDRQAILADLLAWEHPNQGLDSDWIRVDPYDQTLDPGASGSMTVVARNDEARPRRITAGLDVPPGWTSSEEETARVAPGTTTRLELPVRVPEDAPTGPTVVPIDIRWGDRHLRRFREGRILIDERSG